MDPNALTIVKLLIEITLAIILTVKASRASPPNERVTIITKRRPRSRKSRNIRRPQVEKKNNRK